MSATSKFGNRKNCITLLMFSDAPLFCIFSAESLLQTIVATIAADFGH